MDEEGKWSAPVFVNGDQHKTLFSSSMVPGWMCKPVAKNALLVYGSDMHSCELPSLRDYLAEDPAEDPTEATEAPEPAADGNVEAASEAPSEGEKESSQCQSPSLNSKKSVPTGLTAAKSKAAPPKGRKSEPKVPKVQFAVPFVQNREPLQDTELTRPACKTEFQDFVFHLGYRAVCDSKGAVDGPKEKMSKAQKRCQHLLK